jgi:toxin ParE1/3/4
MNVIHLDDFWTDLAEAFAWYEARRTGLGAELALEVDLAVDRVIEAPTRHRTVFGAVRGLRLKRFPYSILYIVEPEAVVFVAVKHGARDLKRQIDDRLGEQ